MSRREVSVTPPAEVTLRKVRPPDGIHPLLGAVRVGGEYRCPESPAAALIETGEFERADEPRKE